MIFFHTSKDFLTKIKNMQTNSKNQQEKILKYNEFAHFFFLKGKSLHLPLVTKLHLNVTNACKNVTLRKKRGQCKENADNS